MPQIHIGNRVVSDESDPYVIAEIGVNHECSLEKAKLLIDLAREGGADAAKFQSYRASALASKHSPAYWDLSKETTTSQRKLFEKYDSFGEKEYRELKKHCDAVGIDFLSTPFDSEWVDFLAPLMPVFKVASADMTNVPLLRRIAQKGKPILLSTGASTLDEINAAVRTIKDEGCRELALLHCILNYPTQVENAHLNMIESLRKNYPEYVIGYSDHVAPDENMSVLTTAYLMGAVIIEKHFTYDKSLPGNDHYHAMDVSDLRRFIANVENVRVLKGPRVEKEPIATEEIARDNARRSIVVRKNIPEGTVLMEPDLICKRPGTGISPTHWDEVLGRTVNKDLQEDHILQWSDLIS